MVNKIIKPFGNGLLIDINRVYFKESIHLFSDVLITDNLTQILYWLVFIIYYDYSDWETLFPTPNDSCLDSSHKYFQLNFWNCFFLQICSKINIFFGIHDLLTYLIYLCFEGIFFEERLSILYKMLIFLKRLICLIIEWIINFVDMLLFRIALWVPSLVWWRYET